MFFYFRQQQLCDTAASTERLRLPGIRWAVTFCLLSPTKNQSQWVFACHREVGELYAPKPLIFHSSRGGPVPCRDPRACGAGKNDEPLPQERVQKQCPSLSWGGYQRCVINCCGTFQAGSGRQLFLSRDHYRRWWPFRLLSLQTAPGRPNCVWVGKLVKHWSLQSWVSILCEWPTTTRMPCQPEALWDQKHCELSNSAEWVSKSLAPVPSKSGRLPGWLVCCGQTLKIVVSFRSSNWKHYFNMVLQRRYPDFSWILTASLLIVSRLTLLSAVCKVL